MTHQILIIDDDQELCELLGTFLELEGFNISAEHDGAQGLSAALGSSPDAIVLDIMLPGMQGLEVLRKLRESSRVPVIMLTARGEDTDRILGLELGADDYLPKPCNPRELAARLRAVLRRSADAPQPDQLDVDGVVLNPGTRQVTVEGTPVEFTSAEFNIMQLLLRSAGQIVDKDTLSIEALGRPLGAYDRSIDVHISKIRRKLAQEGKPDIILSVRGAGYQMVSSSTPEQA